MAQNATIYKVELSVSDMDRHYYETHKLTVAKHPSETDERLMVRIVTFALNAHEHLEMTKGLSTDDEPDIWQKSLRGEIDVWVALGLPSEKVMRQSCSKAAKVIVYPYGGRIAEVWWDKVKNGTTRFDNLEVINFTEADTRALASLANRTMKLQVNIQDGDVMVSVDDECRLRHARHMEERSIDCLCLAMRSNGAQGDVNQLRRGNVRSDRLHRSADHPVGTRRVAIGRTCRGTVSQKRARRSGPLS